IEVTDSRSARPWESVPPLAAAPRLIPVSTPARAERVSAAPLPAPQPKAAPPRMPDAQRSDAAPVTAPDARPAERASGTPVPSARPVSKPPAAERAIPFDATLETILFGRDRSLAIVNGRIVQVGDEVQGARVVDITPSEVMLRDGRGTLRRLSLGQR